MRQEMGAKFDINLILDRKIEYSEFISIIKKINFKIFISELYVIDNWQYENQNIVLHKTCMEIDKILDEGKIVLGYFEIDKCRTGGFFIQYRKCKTEISTWIDIGKYEYLDCDYIDRCNKIIYEQIISWLLSSEVIFMAEICAMGVETDFVYDGEIEACIKNSDNIVCWVMSKHSIVQDIPYYSKIEMDKACIYAKTIL